MPRDTVSAKITKRIFSNPKFKRLPKQTFRNSVSRIHQRNHGITMNAAAYLFAKSKDVGIYNSLSPEDKLSLRYVVQQEFVPETSSTKRVKVQRRQPVEPDFKSPFIGEANDNMEPYGYIYLLENGLRRVILDKLGNNETWWTDEKVVPKEVRDYATRIKDAEKKYPWVNPRASHSLYYVGLYELFRIIETSWKAHFREVFINLEDLRTWIRESVPTRNLVAHNIRTRPLDRTNIKIRTDFICTLIQKWDEKRQI